MNRPKGFKNPYADRAQPPIIMFNSDHEHERQFDRDCVVARQTYEFGADAILASAHQVVENIHADDRFEIIGIPPKTRVFIIQVPMEEGK